MKEALTTIGRNIKVQLSNNKMSQSELARKISYSPATVHKYVDGSIVPNPIVLKNIANALECTVEDLLEGNGELEIGESREKIREIFKTNVNYYLLKNGMLKRDLATKLNISQAMISRYLKECSNPKEQPVIKIAKELNCKPKDLFEKRDERKTENLKKRISGNILQQITKKDLSIAELANKSGLNETTINNYIMLHRIPNAISLKILAETIGCDIESLLK